MIAVAFSVNRRTICLKEGCVADKRIARSMIADGLFPLFLRNVSISLSPQKFSVLQKKGVKNSPEVTITGVSNNLNAPQRNTNSCIFISPPISVSLKENPKKKAKKKTTWSKILDHVVLKNSGLPEFFNPLQLLKGKLLPPYGARDRFAPPRCRAYRTWNHILPFPSHTFKLQKVYLIQATLSTLFLIFSFFFTTFPH